MAKPAQAPTDMDKQMLAGCTGFVFVSFLTFALVVAPWLALPQIPRFQTLATIAATGMVPALITGFVAAKKGGPPGALGFFGGVLASAVFLYLRMTSLFLAIMAKQAPEPDFPEAFGWLMPVAWVLAGAFVVAATWPSATTESDPPH